MNRVHLAVLGLVGVLAMTPAAEAQIRPYIGFVYPAGGQQGTTFQVQLGGQNLDDVNEALVTGAGVRAKVVEYHRRLGPQEMTLLREQLTALKRIPAEKRDDETQKLMAKIEKRMAMTVNTPACASISSLVFVEITVAPDAKPGRRELSIATPRGVSNPLVFYIGQLPEVSRKAMLSATIQVLGKEELALRKRPDDEVEQRISVPCVANGQVASGEVNRYRFEARKGQRLVLSVAARTLVPFIADAVPGWFQPVLALYDAAGKEVAYCDDYRFSPDPVICYEIPKDGEYVFTITDAIYRGREDFVYRVSVSELPFVTSVFPLGRRVGQSPKVAMKGCNLDKAELILPPADAKPGVYPIVAQKQGLVSNSVPFAIDTLPECVEKEPNNDLSHAQKVTLPIIVNGRIDRPDDWDTFEFTGRAGDTVVAEVMARRLDSPLDSMLKITDAAGNLLGLNDDCADLGSGINTHHADSHLMVDLPADGTYYVHVGDTDRHGGDDYAYRLRISAPRPDFALRMVPSSIALRSKSTGILTVYAVRKDGFTGPINLGLKDPPEGISSPGVTLPSFQAVARIPLKTDLVETKKPVMLHIEGRATVGETEIVHEAVPAEDRMQAFLWRHLVPAEELQALVVDPAYQPPARRARRLPPLPPAEAKAPEKPADPAVKPKFSKQQVAGRVRQIHLLFEDGLLTEEFERSKVQECEALQ